MPKSDSSTLYFQGLCKAPSIFKQLKIKLVPTQSTLKQYTNYFKSSVICMMFICLISCLLSFY